MFSGGKDSLSVALLAVEAGVKVEAMYMVSGLDLPGSVARAEHYAGQLGIPLHKSYPSDYRGDLFTLVRKLGYFPDVVNPWCANRLKIRPCKAYLRRVFGKGMVYKLVGVRREESTRRRRIYRGYEGVVKDPEHTDSRMVFPILNWTDQDVAEYLDARGLLESNPLYDLVGVSGCFYCPFYQESIVARITQAFPGIYQPIIDLEREVGKPAMSDHRYLRWVVEKVEAQLALEI